MELASKLPNVGTTIFSTMSALAKEHNAINLSQGFPDFDIDNKLTELFTKYSRNGHNQYAPMAGVTELRQAISQSIFDKKRIEVDPLNEITITAGATQAIYTAITSMISPKDEVIIFSPAYDCYSPTIELCGGKTIALPLKQPNYTINWPEVEASITNKTKLIIINSPHNPTGAILSLDDIKTLEDIVTKHNLYVISDEVYEHIIFDKSKHHSVLDSEKIRKRSFVTFSFGKSLHITGWKLGYCIAPPELSNEFRKVHQFNVFSCNTPAQYALTEYINNNNPFKDISSLYETKRNFFLENIKTSRFSPIKCSGTYFQLLDYSNISDENDVKFAKRLTKEFKIASIPISVFYNNLQDNKVLRFCFAKKEETLMKATDILCKI